MAKIVSLNIQGIDEEGYGKGFIGKSEYFVKNTLPQEIVEIALKPNLNYYLPNVISNISSSRINANCKHFLSCGGCQLQHFEPEYYRNFKTQKVEKYVHKAGYDTIGNFIQLPEYSRRRVTLSIDYNSRPMKIGFLQEFSKKVINIEECVIAETQIFQIIAAIKRELEQILVSSKSSKIMITSTDSGMDLVFHNEQPFDLAGFEKLRDFSKAENINRISSYSNDNFTLILENKPIEIIGKDYKIRLPLNYFIQATKKCEDIFKEKLTNYTQGAKNILDLYSGFGTYSMKLAQTANVFSYEISEVMVRVLNEATRLFPRIFSLQAYQRDLERKPFLSSELAKFDHVIINPPRKGALSQIKELANSNVKKLIIISCNPMTFGRDIYYLRNANYVLEEITIIDQFLYSSHVEILALFTKS